MPWPGVTAIIRIDRIRIADDGTIQEATAWYITSRPDAGRDNLPILAMACRAHWTIENCLHWVRDAVYREDASHRHVGNLPVIFAACFSVSIAVAKRLGVRHAMARSALIHDRRLVGAILGVGLEV